MIKEKNVRHWLEFVIHYNQMKNQKLEKHEQMKIAHENDK